MRHSKAIKAIVYAMLPIAFFLTLRFGFGIMILTNQTNSLPYTFFLYNSKAKPESIKKGDFVLFHHFVCDIPIIKKVIGVEGDALSKTSDAVVINKIVLPLKSTDSTGNEMKALQSDRIKKNHVFVSGTHHNSLDSRYEKFGLINVNQIKGVVCPIF